MPEPAGGSAWPGGEVHSFADDKFVTFCVYTFNVLPAFGLLPAVNGLPQKQLLKHHFHLTSLS